MRPNPPRPPACVPAASARGTHWARVALLAGLAGGSITSAATGVTRTIDCAFCGPGQALPHRCPQALNATPFLSAPNPLPTLVEEARRQHRRLVGISGLDIPDLGDVRTLADLDASLDRVIAAVDGEIERREQEYAFLVRKGATAEAERARLAQLAVQLADDIEQLQREIRETEEGATGRIRAATTTRDEIVRLQKSLTTIREEIRQVRNRLFPRLQQAANHGWILPPSNYRQPPGPLPVTTVGVPGRRPFSAARPLPSTSPDADGAPAIPPPNTAAPSLVRVDLRANVESKLEQLPLLWERARAAVARRTDAIRTLEVQRRESDVQSAQLSTLEQQRTALAGRAAAAKRSAAIARQTAADFAARLSETQATALYAWIEWGIFQQLDRKAEALLAKKQDASKSPAWLQAWTDVAATAAELGSDRLGVIARLPAAMSARGESLDALQRDLAGVREKFGLGSVATAAEVPAPAAPYLIGAPR